MPEFNEKAAITETVTRYFHAIDARDWETVNALFTDQVEGTHGSHQVTLSSEEMTTEHKALAEYDATQYLLGPILVELDAEDRATARFHARATHVLTEATEEPIFVFGGHYTIGLERERGTWNICSLSLDETYHEGDRNLLEAA
jgi:ketosteroid isomerase-like protein